MLQKLGRTQVAIESCNNALSISPQHANAFYNRACFNALINQTDQALADLQQAISLSPEEYRETAKTDTDFDSLRDDSRFKALIADLD